MTKTSAQLDREIAGALPTPGFETFGSWKEVLAAAERGDRLWYLAPMNTRPSSVMVVKIYKNGKLRIDPLSNQADPFNADSGHLSRFRRRA